LLFRPRTLADRRNGDRRLFALKSERQIEKVSVSAEATRLLNYFEPSDLACLDDFVVRLSLYLGESYWHKHEGCDKLLFVQEGVVELETEEETVSFCAGEMTVIPRGVLHRSASTDGAVVLLLERQVPTRGER
jgi:mannose-6-phosphate isomerase-like protein (cupin superfamily)